jgi:hypothetical protein
MSNPDHSREENLEAGAAPRNKGERSSQESDSPTEGALMRYDRNGPREPRPGRVLGPALRPACLLYHDDDYWPLLEDADC